ncbi:PREDICTED: U4/U6 small nuclear ribonucleoprotein Prp3 isoform X2 [Nelumbo nucifera]|uniref:U4/U6 small nuclear ribonucleoprotein Prp3 isoform X2 n=1 Tax=Nelumbo nucifera TaxID=4432 RepID=A0A1U7ZHR4_NELNU|nr:PREDICTED: U4/U6 small nuclear ribonucleoprotein Prp3 isoform X2 [Nelumbo nucifera]
MDRVHEREASSRKSREERERDRDRDSTKDHYKDVDRHRDRDRDRDREHKHRAKDGRSRESEEQYHSDKHRDVRSRESEERHHSDKHRDIRSRESEERLHSDKYREEKRSSRDEKHRDGDRGRLKDHLQDYESKRERSHEPREGREGSRDRNFREGSVEKRSSSSHKRKEREGSEDRTDKSDKKVRVSDGAKEERRERRRFGEKAVDDSKGMNGFSREERAEDQKSHDGFKEEEKKDLIGSVRTEKRERRRFEDRAKEDDMIATEEGKHPVSVGASEKKQGMAEQDSSLEPPNQISRAMPENSVPNLPTATKVSSISTTNENKGVSITRSHEVHGNSSTDGTTSAAGKSASLSLDALAKAKKALQMQKELSEKLKKIPQLNKSGSSDGGQQPGLNKEASKTPLSSIGRQQGSVPPITAAVGVSTSPAASVKPPTAGMVTLAGLTAPNYEAVKRAQELAAKMGFHQDPQFAPLINMFPGHTTTDVAVQPKPAKVPVLRLDALGREIDEHGNVVDMPKPTNLSTLKVNINKQKKEAFQILKPELDVDPETNPHFDARMGINKTKLLRPKRMSFQFVEEGKWSKQAEIIRFKSQFGEAQAKELKTKQAQLAKAKAEPDINPNLIEVSERVVTKEKPKDPIPDVEWWDLPLLLSGTYCDIIEGKITEDKLKMDKITIYVEHPLPIEPPAEPAPPPPQPLKLTKKEQKKLRTQRRLAKEKDRQEMIRQGLIEPPKPKVKMSNLMKVLGSEATQDPTRLEMEIRSAAAEREQAHVDRNIARKLTPAERREKKERKLFEDPNTPETIVSVYKINDLSHPQTRFKVDVNAQENRLTGCAVISDGISVVVVEGGNKPIKRYGKLMLRRINWAASVVNEDDDGDEDEDTPINRCVLVWQGSVAKPSFNRFTVHQCRTEAAAKKVFSDAGVAHYWDLAVNFTDDQM